MAKFRRNHNPDNRKYVTNKRKSGTSVWRMLVFCLAFFGLMYILYKSMKNMSFADPSAQIDDEEERIKNWYFLPEANGQLIKHNYYALSYIEEHEQAEWVAYVLRKDQLDVPNVPRADWFNEDDKVLTKSSKHSDYTRSGFTRGHLAPAGDMAFDALAMQESFYMSNISPQKRAFNNGAWRELEEQVRDWALDDGILYIVTGPVLININSRIGKNKVSVPNSFYKVILDISGNEKKGIAFLLQNEKTDEHLHQFAMTIDELEEIVEIDFFDSLMSTELEETIESELRLDQWPIDKGRFIKRCEKWNNQ